MAVAMMAALQVTAANPLREQYRAADALGDQLLWHPVRAAAERHRDKVALIDGSHILSFGDLWNRVQLCANGLRRLGLGAGSCVVYQLPNWWENVVTHFAIARVGAVGVPAVPQFREYELSFILGQLRPDAVVVGSLSSASDSVALAERSLTAAQHACPLVVVRGGPVRPGVMSFDAVLEGQREYEPGPDPAASEVSTVVYTSGSSGRPKGVLHTHETLIYDAATRIDDFGVGADDVILMPSSLAHIAGLSYGAHLPALVGATTVLVDRWSAATAVDLIESTGVTVMNGAPLMLRGLAEEYAARAQQSNLRLFACGGADVSAELVVEAREALGCFVTRAYGCTEMPTLTWGGVCDDPARAATTDGRAIGLVQLRVVDEDGTVADCGVVGECEAIGPERCVGYVDAALNSEVFTVDGWLRTGDLVSIDRDGYLTVRGRKKDVIVRAGENISAREVEDVLRTHPDVDDTAVIAVPDVRLGERAHAFVVPAVGAAPSLAALAAWLDHVGLAKIKWPESMQIVDALPRTAFGKVDKPSLRAIAQVGDR